MSVSDYIASSGQPEENQFTCIAQDNYKVVINLAMPDSDNAISDEGNIVKALGMQYVHIPVPFNAPDGSHLKTFFDVMDVYTGKKAWVHCALNYRVSAFLYLYSRVIQGVSPQEAKKVMLPSWEPDDIWLDFIKSFDR